MRFNSLEHLQRWQETGAWPAIHDDIAGMAVSYLRGKRLVDLGCSYGLLGSRIMAQAGLEAGLGIDAAGDVLAAGRAAGLPLTYAQLQVTRDTLPALIELVRGFSADVLVARRVLPELFASDLPLAREFAEALAAAGVQEVLLQGRAPQSGSVNALRSVADEILLLGQFYRPVVTVGQVAYLARRG